MLLSSSLNHHPTFIGTYCCRHLILCPLLTLSLLGGSIEKAGADELHFLERKLRLHLRILGNRSSADEQNMYIGTECQLPSL